MKLSPFFAIGLAALATLPGRALGQASEPTTPPPAATPPAPKPAAAPEEEYVAPPAAFDPTLRFYGFADFSYQRDFMDPQSKWFTATQSQGNRHDRFLVGNLNLYMDAKPGAKFRSLLEVRFTYLPASYTNANTGRDYASTTVPVQWGSIIIERAWLEYKAFEFLTLRIGQFFTPYSPWSTDHGSPTLIGPKTPNPIMYALFPDKQVGLEFYGSRYLEGARIGYHLTFSNGRMTNNAPYLNASGKVAVGGRLFVEARPFGDIRWGVSGYMGRYRDDTNLDYNAYVRQQAARPSSQPIEYDEKAIATDVRWEWRDLQVIAELLYQQMDYADNARPTHQLVNPYTIATQAGQPVPDHPRAGGYLMAAYRLPWYGIMPYGWFARVKDSSNPQDIYSIAGGINWRLIPTVVAKLEYTYQWFPKAPAGHWIKDDPLKQIQAQVAWAF